MKQMDIKLAVKNYEKILKAKQVKSKGYSIIDMKLGKAKNQDTADAIAKKVQKTAGPKEKTANSKLCPELQAFVKLIFDKSLMQQSVMLAGFDLNKLPLEQLTEETLKNGYVYLKKIEDLIKAKTPSSNK